MPTKITLIIDNPANAAAFEDAYNEIESSARRLPGLRRLEAAKVWPKEDGTPTPAHRTLDLYFDSYDDASAAVAAPVAGEFFQRLHQTVRLDVNGMQSFGHFARNRNSLLNKFHHVTRVPGFGQISRRELLLEHLAG